MYVGCINGHLNKCCKGNRPENSKIGQIWGGGDLTTLRQAPNTYICNAGEDCGVIINAASVTAWGAQTLAAYSASKAGVIGLYV